MNKLTPNEIAKMVADLRQLADNSQFQSDAYLKLDGLDEARQFANEAHMFFTAANALEKAPVWMERVQQLERELAEAVDAAYRLTVLRQAEFGGEDEFCACPEEN